MTPRQLHTTPEIFSIDEARDLKLTSHRLYRTGLAIPHRGLRINPPLPVNPPLPDVGSACKEESTPVDGMLSTYSNNDFARLLVGRDPSLVISHQTAAEAWGIWLPTRMRTTKLHLSRIRGTTGIPRYKNIVGHLIRPRPSDLRAFNGVRITSPEWTWIDLASQKLTVNELIAAGDALLQRNDGAPRPAKFLGTNPLSTRDAIREVVDRRKGSPGIRNIRMALEMLRERVDSAPESRLRTKLVDQGWPEPDVNPRLLFADGWEAVTDLAFLMWRIALQYEGEHHFSQADQYRSDMNRDEQLRAREWEPIRVDSSVFTTQGWRAFQARLSKAIEQQKQRPTTIAFRVKPSE